MTTNQPASELLNVGHMTYLNSEVFYRKLPANSCRLHPMPPRAMAAAVEEGELQAGPLPIAEVMRLGETVKSLGNLGVACEGEARSVFLFSHIPVEELSGKKIAVTSHTATSIQLLRLLFADHWNVTGHEFVEMSDDHDAALVIGDPALEMLNRGDFDHHHDLGGAWNSLTGLPFVFAEWVIRSDTDQVLSNELELRLVQATRDGLESIPEIQQARTSNRMSAEHVSNYVLNFTYFLGEKEREGQREFEHRLKRLPQWRPTVQTPTAAV